MRIKGLGWWLVGVSAVFLAGCGGGEDNLPDVPHAVLQHHAYDPQVAFDATGNGAAVWSQFDGLRKNLWASRYTASTTAWSAPVLIEANNGGDADFPQLALDSAGNALVVWEQSDSTRRNIWANRYTAASQGWGTAQLLETDDVSFANSPHIALDVNGNGMVVWEQSDGTRKSIWSRRYNVASGQWEAASVIEASTEDANAPHITAADANGNFVAVWRGYDGVVRQRYNLWANRYVVGAGWGSASLISNNTTDPAAISDALVSRNADTPHVAMDAAGNALAVWVQDNSIYANRYTVGAGWGAAQLIESDVNWTAAAPRIAMAADGNAYAVWEQYADGVLGDATPPFKNIMVNRYVPGSGWQSATLVETDNTGHAQTPQVAVDGFGNATVVWRQWDVTYYSVWSNRFFRASGQWDTAALIESDNSGDAVNPQVAVDVAGNALAVWSQSNGTRSSIRANHYTFGRAWDTALILDSN